MSKERLEEMERMKLHAIEHDDIAMLKIIEQAERVQELENKYDNLRVLLDVDGRVRMQEQNKRYREAIEEIKNEAEWMVKLNNNGRKFESILYRCEEALEGEE